MTTPRRHERAAILSVGDELVLGQALDTNSRWLSERLVAMGVRVAEHATIDDDEPAIADAILRLARRASLVISTGGLGPTADDLTRAALARALAEELVLDEDALRRIEARFRAFGVEMTESNRVQAMRPASAESLPNNNGTAPGLAARLPSSGADIFCLPGPPSEMRPMFEESVAPRLRGPEGFTIRARAIHCFGLAEALLADRLGDLMQRGRNPLVGTNASGGVVTCRFRYEGPEHGANEAMAETERLVREATGPYAFGADGETLPEAVLELLRQRSERLVVVESCTGGLLGAFLTEIAGSSNVMEGGWITYSNEMKHTLVGVDPALIQSHGAVSEPVARAMAKGGLERCERAHHALSITGIAGPGGGSDAKPVGTVCIALASRDGSTPARRFHFAGDRRAVRTRSAMAALAMLRLRLIDEERLPLLWEQGGEQRSA